MSTVKQDICLWWVDPGKTTVAHQNHSITSHLSWTRGERIYQKGSWVKIRTERDHSPATVMGKTDLTYGKNNFTYYQPN